MVRKIWRAYRRNTSNNNNDEDNNKSIDIKSKIENLQTKNANDINAEKKAPKKKNIKYSKKKKNAKKDKSKIFEEKIESFLGNTNKHNSEKNALKNINDKENIEHLRNTPKKINPTSSKKKTKGLFRNANNNKAKNSYKSIENSDGEEVDSSEPR